MHDPMVVAFEPVLPLPRRIRWRDHESPRWGVAVSRRTNPENLGQRVYPWWRLKGRTLHLAGRAFGMYKVATIWHVEPDGKDAGTVCRWWRDKNGERVSDGRWRWHIWHWKVQIHAPLHLMRWLMRRCKLCGRRFPYRYAPVSHQWDSPRVRFWQVDRYAYHHECSALVTLRRDCDGYRDLIRAMVGALAQTEGETEAQTVDRLTGANNSALSFHTRYQLQHLMGYERDEDYNLVSPQPENQGADTRGR